MEPQGRKVSLFRPPATYRQGEPMLSIRRSWTDAPTVATLVSKIRTSEQLAERVAAVRAAETKTERDHLKVTTLYCATFSAFYGEAPRRLTEDYRPTGAVFLDFDAGLGLEAVPEARAAAARIAQEGGLPFTIAAWRSASGGGLHCLVHMTPLPQTPEEHERAWAAAVDLYEARLGLQVDIQTSDVSRVAFLSSDRELACVPRTYGLRWR